MKNCSGTVVLKIEVPIVYANVHDEFSESFVKNWMIEEAEEALKARAYYMAANAGAEVINYSEEEV
jgi:hypothetical protein